MKKLLIILVFINCVTVFAQKELERLLKSSGYTNPDEVVTLSASIPFGQAIEVLSEVSKKATGQSIVSTAGVKDPIGIEINNMYYKRALEIIVKYNHLVFEETPDVIIVKSQATQAKKVANEMYAPVDSREVKISAVFFEANITEMKERGINWQVLFSKNGTSIGSSLSSFIEGTDTSDSEDEDLSYQLTGSTEFDVGDYTATAEGVFQFFEENNLGEIIARPTITVRDGLTGRIQIGEDISIKQKDYSGNVTDVFFPTGTIIEVTPHVFLEDSIDYVLLKLSAERSSPTVISSTTTRVSKTNANTEVLMLNGEKTVIGGLIINEETNERNGVPILKDLPWWVLGLKYIFGYTQTEVTQNEVIILLETDILPTLKERAAAEKDKDINLIKQRREENKKAIERYQRENMDNDDKETENNEDKE